MSANMFRTVNEEDVSLINIAGIFHIRLLCEVLQGVWVVFSEMVLWMSAFMICYSWACCTITLTKTLSLSLSL